MKRFVVLVGLLLLSMVLVTGCSGISKDSYDTAIEEVSNLKAQLSNIQADLSKSKADLAAAQQTLTTVTADRDSAKSQLVQANADLTTAQQSFSALNTSAKTYQPYVDASALWLDVWLNTTGWDEETWTAWRANMATVVSSTPDLKAAWDKIRNTTGAEHIAAETAFGELLLQKLTELKPKTQ